MSEKYEIVKECPFCGIDDLRYNCKCKIDCCYDCWCKYHRKNKPGCTGPWCILNNDWLIQLQKTVEEN